MTSRDLPIRLGRVRAESCTHAPERRGLRRGVSEQRQVLARHRLPQEWLALRLLKSRRLVQ